MDSRFQFWLVICPGQRLPDIASQAQTYQPRLRRTPRLDLGGDWLQDVGVAFVRALGSANGRVVARCRWRGLLAEHTHGLKAEGTVRVLGLCRHVRAPQISRRSLTEHGTFRRAIAVWSCCSRDDRSRRRARRLSALHCSPRLASARQTGSSGSRSDRPTACHLSIGA